MVAQPLPPLVEPSVSNGIWAKRWAAAGAAFGLGFPVVALGIRAFELGGARAAALLHSDLLLWIICSAPVFLGLLAYVGGRQQDQVHHLNAHLEGLVAQRTLALARANTHIRRDAANLATLLGALNEGLFAFDRTGRIDGQRSAALQRLLPGVEAHESVADLLGACFGVSADTVQMVLELLWDDGFYSPFAETTALLGTRFERHSANGVVSFAVRYSAILGPTDGLEKVLVLVEDVTKQREAAQASEQASERVARISIAAADPFAFQDFCAEARTLVGAIEAGDAPARNLHTLKGITRMFGFVEVALRLHDVETQLQGNAPLNAWPTTLAHLEADVKDVRSALLLDASEQTIAVPADKLRGLMALAAAHADLAPSLEDLLRRPLAVVLRRHGRLVTHLAAQRDRQVTLVTEGEALSPSEVATLDPALLHLLTNAVTHGAVYGVPLTLRVGCVRKGGTIEVTVADDGAGLDLDALMAKAVARGDWTPAQAAQSTAEDRAGLVFAVGLSTAKQVSLDAGRGEGCAAAKHAIEAAGGTIAVGTAPGEGTWFRLTLPVAR